MPFIAKRIVLAGFILVAISLLSFVITQWSYFLPRGYYIGDICYERFRDRIGDRIDDPRGDRPESNCNRPLLSRVPGEYVSWILEIVSRQNFDPWFGRSDYLNRIPSVHPERTIKSLLTERLPLTITLVGFSTVLIWAFSVPVGIYSALRRNSFGDYAFRFSGGIGGSVPDFLLGMVMVYILFTFFGWRLVGPLSSEYIGQPWSLGKVMDMLHHVIVPGIALGTAGAVRQTRTLRHSLLIELSKPYVVNARSKGVITWNLVLKHPMRTAVRGFGELLPYLLSGSFIVSIVFGLPTLGPLMLSAAETQDMYLAGSILLVISSLSVIGVLISDLMLADTNPRIQIIGDTGRYS